ncbi:MAG: hypothetical protein HON32_03350 [Francisellaceae bacterium]|nr:hypothetical protein [Francisellaceae bacterium]
MFGLSNIKKLFSRRIDEKTKKPTVQIQEKDVLLNDGWVELSINNEPDVVVIPQSIVSGPNLIDEEFEVVDNRTADLKQMNAYLSGVETELLAKKEVYRLSVPVGEHPDKALAAQKRLENQGYTLTTLGNKETQEKGIHLYALVNKNNPDAPVTIVCRGTQFDASMIADLDPTAPGFEVVQKNIKEIRQQLDQLCSQNPGRRIRITGHSLGGALSQLLTKDILDIKRQSLENPEITGYEALAQVPGVDTVVFQSLGLPEDMVEQANLTAKAIKELDPEFDMNFVAHVKKGDFVSRVGSYLFSDIDPSVVDVTLILRDLNKPMVTLGDFWDVGFSAATTGNPIWTAISLVKKCFSRYFTNRLQAHSDLFHHDDDDKDMPSMFGVYRNANPEDREKIKHIFDKDLVSKIPYSKEIQAALFGVLNGTTNEELQGMSISAQSLLTCVNVAIDLTLAGVQSIPKAAVSAARNSQKVVTAIEELQQHAQNTKQGFLNLYNRFVSKTAHNEPEHAEPSRHRLSVAPIY